MKGPGRVVLPDDGAEPGVLFGAAGQADDRQHLAVDDEVAADGNRVVDGFEQPQGAVWFAGAELEPGEVERRAEHPPGEVKGERAAGLTVGVDVPPAQVTGQVVQAVVASQERRLVQCVGRSAERVRTRLAGLADEGGDLGDPRGKRRARGAGPAGQGKPAEPGVEGSVHRSVPGQARAGCRAGEDGLSGDGKAAPVRGR
ncbi:MAG TPA: hypothetical protein VFQ44_08915 [Streptosporangiaceae bacterium]|nr:hypothetical protein [Streptosporangiaceae bacterium]